MNQDVPPWHDAPAWPEQFTPAYDLAGPPPAVRYAICTTPRSGSHFLALMMKNTGLFGCPLEYFHGEYLPIWRRRAEAEGFGSVIRFLEGRRTGANGRLGIKIDRASLPATVAEIGPGFLRGDWRFVFLRRRDLLAQALSWTAAAQTGAWKSDWARRGAAAYSRHEIAWRVGLAARQNASWQQFFAERGQVPLELVYEDVEQDPQGALEAVAGFLGTKLPAGLDAGRLVETRVQRSAGTAAWRERYVRETRELADAVALFDHDGSRRAAQLRHALWRLRRAGRC
ncbi:MAG: Stf0 family sulfotransferase [Dongiaceae bacterium]